MSSRPWLILVLLAVLTTGCGSGPTSFRTLDDFSALDLADHSLITTGSLPPPPKGFSDADVASLAEPLTEMAERGTYDPRVWHPASQQSAIDRVLRDLDPEILDVILDTVHEQLDGRPWASFVGTVFAPDVKVIGKPRMQRATWDVDLEMVDGEPWLGVKLQTRTFYAIRHDERPRIVIVSHTWGLSAPGPVGSFIPSPELAAAAIGAEPCAFILRSVITPEPNEKRYLKEMKHELSDDSPSRFVEPDGDNGDATAKACRT